jgi:hypothetical protein
MMRILQLAACGALAIAFASPILALTQAEAIANATADSLAFCADQGGTLTLPEGIATPVNLTGDGTADDWMINEAGAFCRPYHGYLGGSGGAMIHALVRDQMASQLAGAWAMQDLAFTVDGETMPTTRMVIFGLHGTACNSFGAAPCLLAVTWDGERLISAQAPN